MVKVVVNPRPRVWNAQHGEQRGLFDLLVSIETGLEAREKRLSQGVEELGIVGGGVKDHGRVENKLFFFLGVIREIGLHS